jgi:predicted lipoprotein with Yx(FWY)xxD motif
MSAFGISKVGLGAAGAAALVVLLSACGSGSSSATSGAGPTSAAAPSKPPVTEPASALKTMSTSIGTVLVGPSSRTVYELVGESAANPTCTGGCLAIWPPVTKNGSQVIVNGHPAYTYVNDSAGEATGQNLTDQWGRWLALDASGNPIGASGAPSPSAPGSKTSAPNPGGAAF